MSLKADLSNLRIKKQYKFYYYIISDNNSQIIFILDA
jgi:hypothetical protein